MNTYPSSLNNARILSVCESNKQYGRSGNPAKKGLLFHRNGPDSALQWIENKKNLKVFPFLAVCRRLISVLGARLCSKKLVIISSNNREMMVTEKGRAENGRTDGMDLVSSLKKFSPDGQDLGFEHCFSKCTPVVAFHFFCFALFGTW